MDDSLSSTSSPRPEHELEKVFRQFDANGDGKISETELLSVVDAVGTDASPDDARKMMDEMDYDRDGFVDLRDFSSFFTRHGKDDDHEQLLMDAFKMYDLDGNGRISAKELHLVLRRLGDHECSLDDCARMILSVDGNGDGGVDFHEFKRMMLATKTSASKQQHDPEG